ncbi:hypothetical protein DQ384_38310 [Sphaerisporangium album]|uniref:Uncharacterized protein n=1 Tax=Sphaerisporangium album TaxID=509200 RepID=A0A367ENG3_9ACTN|nr:hypothetical protein [Sphaerisporangium album]RCG19135.1 hypothetical protein DQ384_38310 [Sphaerisporangium album]
MKKIDERTEPFRYEALTLNRKDGYTYSQMEAMCDRARSQAWWNNLVRYGAWEPSNARVSPPPPEALAGIAKLFDTSELTVRTMIATDWYGIVPPDEIPSRVRRMQGPIMALGDEDAKLVEELIRKLGKASSRAT